MVKDFQNAPGYLLHMHIYIEDCQTTACEVNRWDWWWIIDAKVSVTGVRADISTTEPPKKRLARFKPFQKFYIDGCLSQMVSHKFS